MREGTDNLFKRLRLLYSRIGAAIESDLSKFPAQWRRSERVVGVYQDFRGGMSEDDIADAINWLLHHVAHLRNHLFKWAAGDPARESAIKDTVRDSFEIRVCIDLANNETHGGPRGAGESQCSPRLGEVGRVMQLRPGAKTGSAAVVSIGRESGQMQTSFTGGAGAQVIFTGDVLDADGKLVEDVMNIALKAVKAWEGLLNRLGISERPNMA